MADHVKVYEEKKGLPIWAWLLPLLLLLGILAYFLTRHKDAPAVTTVNGTPPPAATVASTSAFPDLGTVHFATDSADLTAEDKAVLDKAAGAMQSNPNVYLRLEGYTDSTGSDTHNLSLSERRAIAVADYLKAKGIQGKRLTGEGFGPANPTDTNNTAGGKADNRRVELFSQQ